MKEKQRILKISITRYLFCYVYCAQIIIDIIIVVYDALIHRDAIVYTAQISYDKSSNKWMIP